MRTLVRKGAGLSAGTLTAAAVLLGVGVGPEGAGGARAEPVRSAVEATSSASDRSVQFGAWVKPTGGWTPSAQQRTVVRYEEQLGRKLDLVHWYVGGGPSWPSWQEPWTLQRGQVPMISWPGAPPAEVASGGADRMLLAVARSAAAVEGRILLRWQWEMDSAVGDDHGVDDPATYVAAWRRARAVFRLAGARNVEWVWCPTAHGFTTGEAQRYYPGDDQVDWLCADGYNWSPVRHRAPWRTFETIFQSFHDWADGRGKPLMVGEFGALERGPKEKEAWIRAVPAALDRLPGIRAVVAFESARLERDGRRYDWRAATSRSSLEAYRDLASELRRRARRDAPAAPGRR